MECCRLKLCHLITLNFRIKSTMQLLNSNCMAMEFIMEPIRITLVLTTLLCSLVAGFLVAFAVVVMPGIQGLNDHGFLQAFKKMDRIIQDSHPIFVVLWLGSVLTLLLSVFLAYGKLEGLNWMLLLFAGGLFILGVQLPTATINIPLNNQLQKQELSTLPPAQVRKAREHFEDRWIQWNIIRTIFAILTSVLLLMLLLRL